MNISPDLIEILRCPHCVSHTTRAAGDDPGRLQFYKETWFICEQCARKYPVKDGIPVMLIEEGDKWASTQAEALPVPPPAD